MARLDQYTVETLPDADFKKLMDWVPARVSYLIKSRFVSWREVLPEWFEKYKAEHHD